MFLMCMSILQGTLIWSSTKLTLIGVRCRNPLDSKALSPHSSARVVTEGVTGDSHSMLAILWAVVWKNSERFDFDRSVPL